MIQLLHRKAASLAALLLLASSLTVICGCGAGDIGPGKYQVSGVITFQGQPLPEGEIIFAPDASAGNQGPACIAYVKDGKYSTQYGKGLVGGAYKIEVEGFETKAEVDVDGETIVAPLFRTFVTTHEFPQEDSTYDLEVEVPKKKRR